MRVIFCGNPEFARPTLDALLASAHKVLAVVTGPDKPSGRGLKIMPVPVKARALEAALPVLQPVEFRDPAFLERVRELNADSLVVVAFRILPRELFALPKWGSFNVHPSLLPRGRGPAPIRWTLLNGETETGVTIIRLSERIDGGGVLRQERIDVAPNENYGSLHDRLSHLGARLLVEVLDAFDHGKPPAPMPQDESRVTRAPKLSAGDYEIDWERSSEEILRRIRAFSPEPGASTSLAGMLLKILEAEEVSQSHRLPPGKISAADGQFRVGTGTVPIRLKQVKPEGRREMSVEDFLRGRPVLPTKFGN